jgi:DNA-binding NarL/FixJ family response regulator
MVAGRSRQAFAERLVITERPVEKHVSGIFTKLGSTAGTEDHRRILAVLACLDS